MADSARTIRAGFLPLLDSAILVVAREFGFAIGEGIDLQLVKETSWANIRDRLTVGHFDVAHLLAPMPIAANLGLNPITKKMIAPMALGLGGNAVTVSMDLFNRMVGYGFDGAIDANRAGVALAAVVAELKPDRRLRFGVVHPHSGHNYELRYWLAGSGIALPEDVEIVVVPPPLLPDALRAGTIDGFCVGEPWNSVAVDRDAGRIVTVKAEIWRSSPEKVLGMTADWAKSNAYDLTALLRALYAASEWAGNSANRDQLAEALSEPRYLGRPTATILRGLSGELHLGAGTNTRVPEFFIPHAQAATFPWQSHALWYYSQMVRWGQVSHTAAAVKNAAESYRPDIFRRALLPVDAKVPGANSKIEGSLQAKATVGSSTSGLILGPDGFFDGAVFDPDQLDAYISSQSVGNLHTK